jgi:hypothetical protein
MDATVPIICRRLVQRARERETLVYPAVSVAGIVNGRALLVVMVLGCFASPAAAQATRTWVASDGDDSNPCSPLAPCKTFAGAISKTVAGGEINCLGPGGFGSVTITKSITIDCRATFGGILAGSTNGVVVNAAASDVIKLRGLSIQGTGTGVNGVRALSMRALIIEDSVITGFNASATSLGIDFAPAASSTLVVSRTTIDDAGIAVRVRSTAGLVNATLERVTMSFCRNGLVVEGSGGTLLTTLRDSVSTANATNAVAASTTGASIAVMVERSSLLNSTTAVSASGGSVTLRLSGNTITGNVTELSAQNGATIVSFSNNALAGNTNNGAPTATALPN